MLAKPGRGLKQGGGTARSELWKECFGLWGQDTPEGGKTGGTLAQGSTVRGFEGRGDGGRLLGAWVLPPYAI